MALFPSAVQAQLQGRHVIASLFVFFDFLSAPVRVWEGDGPIDREGHTWLGMGQRQDGSGSPLQGIDGLEQAVNGSAPQMTMTLSGVDATIVDLVNTDVSAGEVEGREVTIFMGFYDATVAGLVPLDSLVTIGVWYMQRPTFTTSGPATRTITLPCETIFSQRSRAPFGMLTDRDQQKRYPGDKALEFIPKMVDRTETWPEF
jgi:hypothetical protein